MPALYLWSPALAEDNAVEVLVTRGDVSGIAEGSSAFAQGVLETLGLKGQVESWTITPCRSKYFTEYLGENDWRDIWQLVWKVRIQTESPIGSPPNLEKNGVGTDAADDSWTPESKIGDDDDVRCLVIADFAADEPRRAAEAAVRKALTTVETKYDFDPDAVQFKHNTVAGDIEQLQIDLGLFPGKFYAEGADLAEAVMEACEQAGGTVHVEQRPK